MLSNNTSQFGPQTPSMSQSISSTRNLFKSLNVNTNTLNENPPDDFNINNQNFGNVSFNKDNRSQQIQNKRSNMFSSVNQGRSPTSEVNESLISQQGRKQISDFERDEESQQDQQSQQLINTSQQTPIKRRIRMDSGQIKSPLVISKQMTIENSLNLDSGINSNYSNIPNQASQFSKNVSQSSQKINMVVEETSKMNTSRNNSDEEDIENARKKTASQSQKLQYQSDISMGNPEEESYNKVKKKQTNKVQFTEEFTYHDFEVSEKADFQIQFMNTQREAYHEAVRKYDGDEMIKFKSILRLRGPLKRQNSKQSNQVIDSKEDEFKQSIETPSPNIVSRKRQNLSLNVPTSNFAKSIENINKGENQQNSARRASTSRVFENLKGSYEKDNYIKRFSSQHLNIERLHQLIKNKETMRMKYEKILFSFFYLIRNILSLKLFQIESFDKSTINFYSVALKYFRMFLNTSATGIIFFAYCYYLLNDFFQQLKWPFLYSLKFSNSSESEDQIQFINDQSKEVAHFGVILQIIIIIFICYNILLDSSLYSEKQAVRLVFNSLKWNNACMNRHVSLQKKYKIYDKIMEDQDINEGQYPQATQLFLIIVEISLLSINGLCLYFSLDDSKIPSTLLKIGIIENYNILYHIIIGLILSILIVLNQYVIEKAYLISTKMSFSKSESFMMWTTYFNILLIYILFQAKQLTYFNTNLEFHIIDKSNISNPIIHQVQGQLGFIIPLTVVYIIKSLINCIYNSSLKQSQNNSNKYFSNRIYDTNITYLAEEQSKKLQDQLNNTQKDEIDSKNNVLKDLKDMIVINPEPDGSPNQLITTYRTKELNDNYTQTTFQPIKQTALQSKYNWRNYPLILESTYYGNHIIMITIINSCLINCIFTYPLIFIFGLLINFVLIVTLYVETIQIAPSRCQTFLTTRKFSSIMSTVIYIFFMIVIGQNCIIGFSNRDNSHLQIAQSLFSSGFSYLFDNIYINQIFYVISMPYFLYAIIIYLIAFLFKLNNTHLHQFSNFKATISRLRLNPSQSNALLSVQKSDINTQFKFIK